MDPVWKGDAKKRAQEWSKVKTKEDVKQYY